MAERDATSIVDDATGYIDEQGGLGMFIVNVGFGGLIMSAIYGGIDTVEAAFLLIYGPIEEFALSLVEVVDAVIGGQADIVLASVETAIGWFVGPGAILGPLSPILGIVVIGAMTYLIVRIWQEIPISPLTFIMDR